MDYVLGYLGSGEEVIDRIHDPHHIIKPAEFLALAVSSFGRIDSFGRKNFSEVLDFSEVAGMSYCVPTGPQDSIFWARIIGKNEPSRFVRGKSATESRQITYSFSSLSEEGRLNLAALNPGQSYPEPWQTWRIEKIRREDPMIDFFVWRFWQTHAFVEGFKPIDKSSITLDCPWSR